jgi:hypothetical protein
MTIIQRAEIQRQKDAAKAKYKADSAYAKLTYYIERYGSDSKMACNQRQRWVRLIHAQVAAEKAANQ